MFLVRLSIRRDYDVNHGVEHYFEMSKPDAERALAIYKTFAKQTDQVVKYLSAARQYTHATRVDVPKIKHAPTSLVTALEEYLNDKDFETNRRQYLAQQEAKKGAKYATTANRPFDDVKVTPSRVATGQNFPSPKMTQAKPVVQPPKGPPADLMDFFESIEQNQQPMANEPAPHQHPSYTSHLPTYPQQAGFTGQQSIQTNQQQGFPAQQLDNPYRQIQQTSQQLQQSSFIQPQFTGAGFGGYTPQPQQQIQQQEFGSHNAFPHFPPQNDSSPASPILSQSTNPFRQSTMPIMTGQPSITVGSPISMSPHIGNNPFGQGHAKQDIIGQSVSQQSFAQSPQLPSFPQQGQAAQSLMPQRTGTNPFARGPPPNLQQQQPPAASSAPFGSVVSHATGSTNPFRQSTFVNQQTGQGWQTGPQGTMGGFEALPTVPIFPRPGQPQVPQTQQSPW